MRLRLDLEGWCQTSHDLDEGWLQIALEWLHECCMGYVLGRKEAGARNLAFFRVKWLQPVMKGTSSVRRLRPGSFRTRLVPSMCFATSGCSCGVVLCVS